MKKFDNILVIIAFVLCFLLLVISATSLIVRRSHDDNIVSYDVYIDDYPALDVLWNASEAEMHEIVQDYQVESDALNFPNPEQEPDILQGVQDFEEPEYEEPVPEDEFFEPPVGWDYSNYENPILSNDSDILDRLDRIDYSLRIISGGVILGVCSLFAWFTIIKPLKQFIVF